MMAGGGRWGRFFVSGEFLTNIKSLARMGRWYDLEGPLEFMGQCFIVRATDSPRGDTIEYTAISRLFDEVEEGHPIPEYAVEFTSVRTCTACGGVEWGPDPGAAMGERSLEIVCMGCCGPVGNSVMRSTFERFRRLDKEMSWRLGKERY